MRVIVNCKWMAQGLTGTQRFASELTKDLNHLDGADVVLAVPADAVIPDWAAETFQIHRSKFRGILFEQVALPLISTNAFLVNLGGPAPILKREQLVTMHDASFVHLPETYSKMFVTWYRVLYKVLSRRARCLVTVSNFSANELARFLGIPVERFSVISNGADHVLPVSVRKPDAPLPARPFALCVGTLARHKNLRPTVESLSSAGIATVVVGASGNARVFSSNSTSFTESEIYVMGRIDDEELKWLYLHATALVFPSLYEGFGLPVVEAQQCGCPVISSDVASLPEVGGAGAAFFSPSSVTDVPELFNRIHNDTVFRETLIAAGAVNVERYQWAGSRDKLKALIGRCVEGKKGSRIV